MEKSLNLFMLIYVFGYKDFKNAFLFFRHFLKQSKLRLFFSNYFMFKNSETLSTYSIYEFLQLKNTKFAINASEKSVKNFENLLRVPWGKLNLEHPICCELKNKIRYLAKSDP